MVSWSDKLYKKDILIQKSWQYYSFAYRNKEKEEKAITVKLTPPFV